MSKFAFPGVVFPAKQIWNGTQGYNSIAKRLEDLFPCFVVIHLLDLSNFAT